MVGMGMGTFMGWMASEGAMKNVGIGFVAAHILVIFVLIGFSLLFPTVRRWTKRHFTLAHIATMVLGMVLGGAIGHMLNLGALLWT